RERYIRILSWADGLQGARWNERKKNLACAATQVVGPARHSFPGLANDGVVGAVGPMALYFRAAVNVYEEPTCRAEEREEARGIGGCTEGFFSAIDGDCHAF